MFRLPLLLLAAAGATFGAVHPCPVVDLIPGFLKVLDMPADTPRAEQVEAFRRLVVADHPELFAAPVMHVRSPEDLDRRIPGSLAESRRSIDAIRSMHAVLKEQMPARIAAFAQAFPDFECDFPIYLMPSLGQFDGGGRIVGGKPALVFGVDAVAAFHTPAGLKIFFAHELFHRYHSKAAGMSDDLSEKDAIWRALWAEGLATYVSMALNPGTTVQEALFLPNDLVARAEPHLRELAAELGQHLDEVNPSIFAKYFYGGQNIPNLPARTGYYVGCLIAQRAARNASLSTLAHWRGDELRARIGKALAELQ